MTLDVVILAAGKGSRMKSEKAKVLHLLGEKPLIAHVVDVAKSLNPQNLAVVVGHQSEEVTKALPDGISLVNQEKQLGTGHAVSETVKVLDGDEGMLLVMFGDVPFVTSSTLNRVLDGASDFSITVLTAELADPGNLGRIVRDASGNIKKIVEAVDATEEEKTIREINSGIMAIRKSDLIRWLPKVKPANKQGELYLTDLVEIALAESAKVRAIITDKPEEVLGINSQWDLSQAERLLQKRRVKELALRGARIADPDRLDIRGDVEIGNDCFIDVNVVLEGSVVLGDDVSIGPGAVVIDSKLGVGTKIHAHSVVEGAETQANCTIGPFARVRPGTIVEERAKIGNFVETKMARLGPGSKASHLAYLGDADIGADCNIGAGTVTCNYDGVQKNETKIGDGVFVGTNSTLVAPIKIDKEAYIAAGSTITSHVKENDLAVGRSKQRNIEGWLPPSKRK